MIAEVNDTPLPPASADVMANVAHILPSLLLLNKVCVVRTLLPTAYPCNATLIVRMKQTRP
jgi:hypothetical protein